MTRYGYCRISTAKQSIDRQIRNIKTAYPDAVIVTEIYTGATDNRKEWNKLINKVQAGDTIIFDSVSRMSRNAEKGFKMYVDLYNQGVELIFLKEPHVNTAIYKDASEKQIDNVKTGDLAADELVNTITAAVNKYMFKVVEKQIILALEQSEKEVADLRQRTKEGIVTAHLNGKKSGHAEGTKLTTKKSIAVKKDILRLSKEFGGSLNDKDLIQFTGINRNTFYKYKRELKEELNGAE